MHDTVTKQQFLIKNGPDPLLSKDLRVKALDRMWPDGQWHFLVGERIERFKSETVSTLITNAKKKNKFVF